MCESGTSGHKVAVGRARDKQVSGEGQKEEERAQETGAPKSTAPLGSAPGELPWLLAWLGE